MFRCLKSRRESIIVLLAISMITMVIDIGVGNVKAQEIVTSSNPTNKDLLYLVD